MCKNANGSEAMANMMAEHQRFLEECERRLQEAKATSTANRVAIEEIAKRIEKIATEVNDMNTMAHESSKTTQDGELERTINAESARPCADDDYPYDLNDYLDEWEEPDEWDDYPDDWEESYYWDDYPDDYWEDSGYNPAYWESDDWEEIEEKDDWEDPNDIDNYFDGEFLPEKAGIYTSWRGYEYAESMPKVVNVSRAKDATVKEAAEESTDPLWDCWYNVAKYYEPDNEKIARQVKKDEWGAMIEELYEAIWNEVFDMDGIIYEDLIADEIYFADKLIQRGQVAKRRKKTYWHGQRLRKNAITMQKSYNRRWQDGDCSYCFKKNGRMVKNDGKMWNRTQSIIVKALKKKVISFS